MEQSYMYNKTMKGLFEKIPVELTKPQNIEKIPIIIM